MQIARQKMPEQDAAARAANFKEVNLGFTEQLALLEADRCLQCKEPRLHPGLPGEREHSANFSICSPQGDWPTPRKACSATTPCPPSPAGCVRRKRNAKPSASAGAKGRRSASATWNVSWPIGRANIAISCRSQPRRPASAWPSSAPVPAGLTAAGELASAATT